MEGRRRARKKIVVESEYEVSDPIVQVARICRGKVARSPDIHVAERCLLSVSRGNYTAAYKPRSVTVCTIAAR